jgi:exonuclease SbcD
MRFIHTADWHLGRILFGVHLTEDQALVLDHLADIIRETEPDMLVVSGDVYDRAVPPPEAVRLLDDFLGRVVGGLGVKVLMTAGNHDSPDRIGFAAKILEAQGLFMRGSVRDESRVTVIEDSDGPVEIHAIPYAEPSLVREVTSDDKVRDHETAMEALMRRVVPADAPVRRRILAAHAFVAGGDESESERPLAVGGSASVPPSVFKGFDYVALGHLHRPQKAGAEHIRYSGSLFPYSFSEADHEKSVNLVDMDRDGVCRVEAIPLSGKRRLRIVRGTIADLLTRPPSDDYIQATLEDRGPVLDAFGRLRSLFPNLLHIERPCLAGDGLAGKPSADHRKTGHADLFRSFYKDVTGKELTAAMEENYIRIVEGDMRRKREAAP